MHDRAPPEQSKDTSGSTKGHLRIDKRTHSDHPEDTSGSAGGIFRCYYRYLPAVSKPVPIISEVIFPTLGTLFSFLKHTVSKC